MLGVEPGPESIAPLACAMDVRGTLAWAPECAQVGDHNGTTGLDSPRLRDGVARLELRYPHSTAIDLCRMAQANGLKLGNDTFVFPPTGALWPLERNRAAVPPLEHQASQGAEVSYH